MTTVLYNHQIEDQALKAEKIAIIGYGSQGHAHALNLKESGFDVVVGLRKGKSWDKAEKDGVDVTTVPEAVKQAKVVMILLPDEYQPKIYEEYTLSTKIGRAHV